MNTFLPHPHFHRSAKVLDRKRLGKQRVECKQILDTLLGRSKGWTSHPAVRMWKGYEAALCQYAMVLCKEWVSRGYTDNLHPFFLLEFTRLPYSEPRWLGDIRLHSSHRSNLLRKDVIHYGKFGWTELPTKPYFWPTKDPKYADG